MLKKFIIRCSYCSWSRFVDGLESELKDLREIKPSCKTCNKPRMFVCPSCQHRAKMTRIAGNT